jgi:hypothetical protein
MAGGTLVVVVVPKREPPGPPMAGGTLVVVPNREPPGAPIAGATLVVVVGAMVEVVVVGEPADAVTGCETDGVDVVGVDP